MKFDFKLWIPVLVAAVAVAALVILPEAKGTRPMSDSTNPLVLIETTMGNITIELDAENAPVSTENFLAYVEDGYFVDTIFHRIIPNFMVQGGGMNADMADKPSTHAAIKNEANNGLKNDRGTLAMARTQDPDSATSQFFINLKDNEFLNFTSEDIQGWGYAVFGKITEGMDIVDKMAAVATTTKGGHQDVPNDTITMTAVSIVAATATAE